MSNTVAISMRLCLEVVVVVVTAVDTFSANGRRGRCHVNSTP